MKKINITAFKSVWDNRKTTNIKIIDVRMPLEFKESHVVEALNMPLSTLGSRKDALASADEIYILCKSGARSCEAADITKDLDAEIYVVDGGTDAWLKAGYPVMEQKVVLPLMRQVFLAAGVLVLLGSLGAMFINDNLIYIAVFVGMGLTLSGLSGWCGMAKFLALMPWNR